MYYDLQPVPNVCASRAFCLCQHRLCITRDCNFEVDDAWEIAETNILPQKVPWQLVQRRMIMIRVPPMIARELFQLLCFVTNVLIEGEKVWAMRSRGRGWWSNKGELETGFAWKPRVIAETKKKKYYTRCHGGDSRRGQLMLRNGRMKEPGIAPPNDLQRYT